MAALQFNAYVTRLGSGRCNIFLAAIYATPSKQNVCRKRDRVIPKIMECSMLPILCLQLTMLFMCRKSKLCVNICYRGIIIGWGFYTCKLQNGVRGVEIYIWTRVALWVSQLQRSIWDSSWKKINKWHIDTKLHSQGNQDS